MDPVIIRAYQLKLNDKFKKVGFVYKVVTVDETGIYYVNASDVKADKQNVSKEYSQRFGTASHEMIELIERSNYNE